jgi:hypothetical protein
MVIDGIHIDASKGFDVFSGNKKLKHFSDYLEARTYAQARGGRWLRYWALKNNEATKEDH